MELSDQATRARTLSTGTVAARLGWSERTVRRRCETGDIPGAQLIDGGHWRIPASWLAAMLAEMGDER